MITEEPLPTLHTDKFVDLTFVIKTLILILYCRFAATEELTIGNIHFTTFDVVDWPYSL